MRRHVKKLSLELGGNAPFIVFDDADIEMAVKGGDRLVNTGMPARPVSAPTAILVQDGVYDAFTSASPRPQGDEGRRRVRPGAVFGPLIDMKAIEKVEAHIVDALTKGAKVVTGGKHAARVAASSSRRC